MLTDTQQDILHELAKRFVRYRPKTPAEANLQDGVKQLLSSFPSSERQSYEWQMGLCEKLQDVFPSILGSFIVRYRIRTIEDARFLTTNLLFARLDLSIELPTDLLEDIGQLAPEFSSLAGRVKRLSLCETVPAEFAKCVNAIEPLELVINSKCKQLDPKFFENLSHVKRIMISIFCGEKETQLIKAILQNPSIEASFLIF